ncbi:hypothetical protein BGZ67_004194 [Mortierella alpina]|nr:hypothetical protein BGZ67_004194 [Mortierella alpina]
MSSPDMARPAPDSTPKPNQDADDTQLDTSGNAIFRSAKGPAGDTPAATQNKLESTRAESAAIMEPSTTSTPPRNVSSPKDQNDKESTPMANPAPIDPVEPVEESLNTIKDPDADVDTTMQLQGDDAAEIASDIQERSQLSVASSHVTDLNMDHEGDAEPTADATQDAPSLDSAVIPAMQDPAPASKGPGTSKGANDTANGRDTQDNTALAAAGSASANTPAAVSTTTAQPPTSTLRSEEGQSQEESTTETAASYTSPNHEWARILQKRLGKGLSDAQMLARSNSMLASPSILAQSLTQVIPSLQVKENSALSPGSSNREYQTPEELFDRPAAIEPSTSTYHYEDEPSRDDAFPSSALANNSQKPLLLFAPLNPDQLYGKSSSTLQPTAPPPPVESPSLAKASQPQPTSQPKPTSQPAQQPPQAQPHQPGLAPTPVIPIPKNSPLAGTHAAVAPSPGSRTNLVSPTGKEARTSPSQSREQALGAKNPRQSLVLQGVGQDDRLGPSSQNSASRTLMAHGSSSSLNAAPTPPAPVGSTSQYPIAPIQYTPLTQYKANPAKEGSKSNKKPRDAAAPLKETTTLVDSPLPVQAAQVQKEPSPPSVEVLAVETNTQPPVIKGSPLDITPQWALEALSGLSDVNFDSTLPVSAAVATTLATSSSAAPSKTPMAIPPISAGSRSNVSAVDASPRVAKVIPSPFESARISIEMVHPKTQNAVPDMRSQPLQPPAGTDITHNSTPHVPQSPAMPFAVPPHDNGSRYAGVQDSIANRSNHPTFEQHTSPTALAHGGHGSHQAGRSISSLRDIQIQKPPIERSSLEAGHLRRGDAVSADTVGPTTSPSAPPAKPTVLSLGSSYQIPWLPQSRPVLPPKADINSIDVPALTGKQLLPTEPRLLDSDSRDPALRFSHLGEALRYWGQHTPEGNAFANLDGKGVECGSWDWSFTLGRAEMIAKAIHDKTQLRAGARVALVFRLSEILEFVAALYGAILAGVVPVLVNQIQEFSEMVYIMTSAKVELALTTQVNHKSLQKDLRKGAMWPTGVTWWQTDILETWAPKNNQQERLPIRNTELAYIEYTKSAAGELKGVAVSHKNLMTQCRALYSTFLWRPALYRDKNGHAQPDPSLATDPSVPFTRDGKRSPNSKPMAGTVMSWLEPRQQSGLILGCIMGVHCGSFTVFMESSITAISGLWAHSVAAYRANIAFTDYNGIEKMLRNFRINPQATVTPTRPDLRFLNTIYVDTQRCNPVLNREFLDDYLYPLGMVPQHDISTHSQSADGITINPSSPERKTGKNRNDLGVIAYLSLLEHGGMIVCTRDALDPPPAIEKVDLRKQYRKSTLPDLRRPSVDQGPDGKPASSNTQRSTEHRLQLPEANTASKDSKADSKGQGSLSNHPVSSLVSGNYLLHRASLRSNRVVVLATGDEAIERQAEHDTILVGAFGYPLAQSTALVVDPETLALSLPEMVGEIWVSSPGMPVGFWGLPEHTQEIFNAKPYIVTEETMIPTLYRPPGAERMLRTGLLGTIIEGRIIIFGSYWDRLQQDLADPMKPIGSQYEYHHTSDLLETLLNNIGGIGVLSIFECFVNKEYLPVVCIELSKESRSSGQPLNTVAQHVAINARHVLKEVNALRSYCVAVWDMNTLPRIFENGRRVVDHALTKKMFELGRIFKILYFATFTDDVLFNIPRGDDPTNGFWSRECIAMRQRRQGAAVRYVQYTSNITSPDAYDEKTNVFMGKFHSITDVLIWRSIIQPDDVAFIELDARGKEHKSIPFKKFNQKVTGYAMHLDKKCGLKAGDHVVLWFSQDMEYIVTLHACWVLGLIPIPLPLPDNPHLSHLPSQLAHFAGGHTPGASTSGFSGGATGAGNSSSYANNPALTNKAIEDRRNSILRTLMRIMDEVKVKAILGNMATDEYLKLKSTGTQLRSCRAGFTPQYSQTLDIFTSADLSLPPFYNVTKAAKTKQILGALSGYAPRKEWFGPSYPAVYLIDPEAKLGSIASRKLLMLNHETLNNLCRNQKRQFNTTTGQPVVTCMSLFTGLGFIHGCLSGIYNGGPTIVLQTLDYYANPIIWLEVVSRYKAQDIALTYPLLDLLLMRLDGSHGPLNLGSVSLDSVRNFMVCGHGRIQREKYTTTIGRLGPLKMEPEALNLIYSHPLNFMVTSQAERATTGPVRIHVSSRHLRFGIVKATSEGDDHTGVWLEDVGISTVCTSIAIVHPETFEVCGANQIGEIWVCSDSSANSFHLPPGYVVTNPGHPQPFGACISGYDNRVRYVRTGDLGFLWNSQQQQLMNQPQWSNGPNAQATAQANAHATSGSFQLFVLGSMEESFQMHGLLHFAVDVETTVEGSHANVASQGCLTFKTPQGQVVCVVKVLNQEPEVLVSMYIPIMHAILEQHQFLPDTIVLVGETVSTARRVADGLKPREAICGLYTSERLPILHLHHCHGKALAPVPKSLLPPIHERGVSSDSTLTSPPGSRGANYQLQIQHPPVSSAGGSSNNNGGRMLPGISPAPILPTPSNSNNSRGGGFNYNNNNNGSNSNGNNLNSGTILISGDLPGFSAANNPNRSSLYGSPLLVANIPLPPGTANPLVQSPMSAAGYQPQTLYQPGGANSLNALPVQPSASTVAAAAAALPRPMSQQAFVGHHSPSPLHSVSVGSNGVGLSAAGGGGGSGSATNASVAQSLANEMAMWGGDRSRGPRLAQQQHSQPHLHQGTAAGGGAGGQQRPAHTRQMLGQDGRSLSAEELTRGSGVKGIMKGMNAKWSEMRKTGLN